MTGQSIDEEEEIALRLIKHSVYFYFTCFLILVMFSTCFQGGYVTTSEISVMLTDRENDVIYQCHATNDALGQTVVDTVTLEVMCQYQGVSMTIVICSNIVSFYNPTIYYTL